MPQRFIHNDTFVYVLVIIITSELREGITHELYWNVAKQIHHWAYRLYHTNSACGIYGYAINIEGSCVVLPGQLGWSRTHEILEIGIIFHVVLAYLGVIVLYVDLQKP